MLGDLHTQEPVRVLIVTPVEMGSSVRGGSHGNL